MQLESVCCAMLMALLMALATCAIAKHIVCPNVKQAMDKKWQHNVNSKATCEQLREEGPEPTPLDMLSLQCCSSVVFFCDYFATSLMLGIGYWLLWLLTLRIKTWDFFKLADGLMGYCIGVADLMADSWTDFLLSAPRSICTLLWVCWDFIRRHNLDVGDFVVAFGVVLYVFSFYLMHWLLLLMGILGLFFVFINMATVPFSMLLSLLPSRAAVMGVTLWQTTYHMDQSILVCQKIPGAGTVAFTTYGVPISGAYAVYRLVCAFSSRLQDPVAEYTILGRSIGLLCSQVWLANQAVDALSDLKVALRLESMTPPWIQCLWWISTFFSIAIPLAWVTGRRSNFAQALFDEFMFEDIWQAFVGLYLLFNVEHTVVNESLVYSVIGSIASLVEAYSRYKPNASMDASLSQPLIS